MRGLLRQGPRPASLPQRRAISVPHPSLSPVRAGLVGLHRARTSNPCNFSHPARPGRPPTETSMGTHGLEVQSSTDLGAPVGPVCPGRPVENPSAARSCPLVAETPGTGWGRGGGSAQALSPRPAGFARGPRHAPRTRSTWPRASKCTPDPRDAAPGSSRAPLNASCASVFPGVPCYPLHQAGSACRRLCIWRAKSRGRLPVSPQSSHSRNPRPSGTRSTGLFTAPAGNHLRGKQTRTLVLGGGRLPPPSPSSSRSGPRGGRREPLRRCDSPALLRRGSRPWERAIGDARGTEVKETPR